MGVELEGPGDRDSHWQLVLVTVSSLKQQMLIQILLEKLIFYNKLYSHII